MATMQDWVNFETALLPGSNNVDVTGIYNDYANRLFGGDRNALNQFINWGSYNGGPQYMPSTNGPTLAALQDAQNLASQGKTVIGGPGFTQQILNAINGNNGSVTPSNGTPGNLPTNGVWDVNQYYTSGTPGQSQNGPVGLSQFVGQTVTPTVPNLSFSPTVQQAVQQAPVNAVGPGTNRNVTNTTANAVNASTFMPRNPNAPALNNYNGELRTQNPVTGQNPTVPAATAPNVGPSPTTNLAVRPKSYSFSAPGWNGANFAWR